MMQRTFSRVVAAMALAGAVCLLPHPSIAQRRPAQEFTRQGLLITNFAVGSGIDLRTGRRAGDFVRGRVAKLVDKRAITVIDDYDIRDKMYRAGFNPDSTYTVEQIFSIGRVLRADEYVEARVTRDQNRTRLTATLVLMRDKRMQQPLPAVTGATLEEAADAMARNVNAALGQLVLQRRCENALREGKGSVALSNAREAVTLYPSAVLARICLGWALRATGASDVEVLTVAEEILAIEPTSFHALESAALALDSLRRKDAAATMWLRFAATDTNDLELAHRAINSMMFGGTPKRAEPLVLNLSNRYRDNVPMAQQKWRVTFETKNWPKALEAGEFLLERDSIARADSTFWLRLATVYRASNLPFKAVETLARAVSSFPRDPRLYALYTQYVKTEADSVLPRGLQLFPQSADLQALNAKELRGRGKLAESLEATKRAIELDSAMSQGELMVAQLEMELGRPDNALSSLRRALTKGEDSSVVAQFALSKGNTLYRAANGTRLSGDFGLALRFLALSDSVKPTVQSTFLMGATALGLAQAALTEAPKLTDRVEQCRLAKLGAEMVPVARTGLQAGQTTYGEAAKQSLDYLITLDPFVAQQMTAFCGSARS
ncbi:MAG: hypothetical protein ABIR92_06205 [Gemmatimonadaceae bacterium]